ncbi:hypothetical protein Tco_1512771, partial [Tanacetum coccineum]
DDLLLQDDPSGLGAMTMKFNKSMHLSQNTAPTESSGGVGRFNQIESQTTKEEGSARYASTSHSERVTPSSRSFRSSDHRRSRRDSPEYDTLKKARLNMMYSVVESLANVVIGFEFEISTILTIVVDVNVTPSDLFVGI